jgi:Flp pilus assembly protein TadD
MDVMSLALVAPLLLASAPITVTRPDTSAQPALGYVELSENRDADALRVLAGRIDGDDPAHMINLGTAYARVGRPEDARRAFASAVHSEGRSDLLLATGAIMDSRVAAKLALRNLKAQPAGYGLAARDLFRR